MTQAPKVQSQLDLDVILILADVISHGTVLLFDTTSNSKMLYNQKDKVTNYYSVYSNLSWPGLHKYTKILFYGIHLFRGKAVGFLENEKFKI